MAKTALIQKAALKPKYAVSAYTGYTITLVACGLAAAVTLLPAP